MRTRAQVLTSEGYHTTKIQQNLFRAVNDYLVDESMSRKDFAEKLGVSKGRMTQILNGDFNGRLDRLVTLALAAGRIPELKLHHQEEFIAQDARQQARAHAARCEGKSMAVIRMSAPQESAHGISARPGEFTGNVTARLVDHSMELENEECYGC